MSGPRRLRAGKAVVPLALLCAWAAPASAVVPGAAGGTFLKIALGARPAGMGEAYCAAGDDVAAVSHNPAGAAWSDRVQFAFEHLSLSYGDGAPASLLESVAASAPLRGIGTVAVQARYLGYGASPGYDAFGAPIGNWSASDLAAGAAFARVFSFGAARIAGGAGLKAARVGVAGASSGVAPSLDLGAQIRPRIPGVRAGVSVANAGGAVRMGGLESVQPLTFRAGGAYDFETMLSRKGPSAFGLLAALDVVSPRDRGAFAAVGLEGSFRRTAYTRVGFRSGADQGALAGLSAGLGGRYEATSWGGSLDASFSPAGVLGSQIRVSLTIRLRTAASAGPPQAVRSKTTS